MMVEAVDNKTIPAHAGFQPLGHAGYGRCSGPGFFGNGQIRLITLFQHPGHAKTVGEFPNFPQSQKIAKESLAFRLGLEGQYSFKEPGRILSFPIIA